LTPSLFIPPFKVPSVQLVKEYKNKEKDKDKDKDKYIIQYFKKEYNS